MWTEQAAKKARKAELESYLLGRYKGYLGGFVSWLCDQAYSTGGSVRLHDTEAAGVDRSL